MLLQVFSIYDCKVDAYMNPVFMHSKGQALRWFLDLLKEKDHPVASHPADYTLFHIGEYDDSIGKFFTFDANINLGNALELS